LRISKLLISDVRSLISRSGGCQRSSVVGRERTIALLLRIRLVSVLELSTYFLGG